MGLSSVAVLLLAATSLAAAEPVRLLVVGTEALGDAQALNAAIEGSPTGCEIVLRGRFLLDQTVRLRGGRTYSGESRHGTVLRQADGANLSALVAGEAWLDNTTYTGEPLTIRSLSLEGNRRGNPDAQTTGLVLRSWLSVAEDLSISGMGGDGVRLTSLGAAGASLTNTQVNGRIADCFITDSGRHGLNVEDPGNSVTDWILRDCWIASSGADGIHLDNSAGWMVVRNHIYGVGNHAISAHRLFGTTLSDNYIEDFGGGAEAGSWCGLRATLQGDAASTIAGNRIFNFGGEKNEASTYVYLSVGVNYGTGLVSVVNNVIRGAATERGIGLRYSASGDRHLKVVSSGNAVASVATPLETAAGVELSAGI